MSAAISYPVLVDVTAEYVTASVRGCQRRISWGTLREAASQSDSTLSAVYGRLLHEARREARRLDLTHIEYATVDRAASSPSLDRLVEYVSREWPGLLRRGVLRIEVDPDRDANLAGVVQP